ncbi:MAG TPA: TetR/AcrR family transcriptional regulator [Candidatus Dormibacteraeota bacterium]|nr:TetR/AcrR family transcriptional regulator [Candidatus Dormibacteraeota bacterium]
MPPTRRTQAERSAATQAKLLDAALDCLVELGYAGTTTTVVAERAGVSRGAQLHHFPTRAALVAAAVEHLYRRLTSDYQRGFAALAPRAERLRAAIRLLWSMYSSRHFPAVIELFTAARSDGELRAHLEPIAARHQRNVHRLAREYFPDAARLGRRFDATLALLLDAMQGMASSEVPRGPIGLAARLDFLHDIAATALASAAGTEHP